MTPPSRSDEENIHAVARRDMEEKWCAEYDRRLVAEAERDALADALRSILEDGDGDPLTARDAFIDARHALADFDAARALSVDVKEPR